MLKKHQQQQQQKKSFDQRNYDTRVTQYQLKNFAAQ